MSSLPGHIRWRRRTGPRYRYVRWRWRLVCGVFDAIGTAVFWFLGMAHACLATPGRWIRRVCRLLLGREYVFSKERAFLPEGQSAKDPVRRILIIQLDHLGDAILSQVMFPLLRRHYPEAEIDVLASPWNQAIFEMIPEVHQVHLWGRNRFCREGRFGWMGGVFWWGFCLRRWQYDLGIDVRGELPHAMLMWLAGIQRRVGWDAGGGGFLLTDSPRFVPHRPEVDSRLALLAALGIGPDSYDQSLRPKLVPPTSARQTIGQRLAEIAKDSVSTGERIASNLSDSPGLRRLPWIVCHIGAGTEAKQWPLEHWSALIAALLARCKTVLLVGSKQDQSKGQEILRRLSGASATSRASGTSGASTTAVVRSVQVSSNTPESAPFVVARPAPADSHLPTGPGRLWDWTGQVTVQELAALLERVELFIGADSGPAHLAAAVGTPVVVLFSGTNRVRQWRPRGPSVQAVRHPVACSPCHRSRCPLPEHPCVQQITPQQVLETLTRLQEGDAPRATEEKEAKDVSLQMGPPMEEPPSPELAFTDQRPITQLKETYA